MSHKASSWLAEIPAEAINAGAFRVLFHLCDAHNSKRDRMTACFPSQETLRQVTGLSNGGLNNALNAIEKAGLMRRRRTRNADGTKGPTYYILGCDGELPPAPSPENGVGTISKLEAQPSPNSGTNHLHSTGDKPVIEPVKEPVSAHGCASDLFSASGEGELPQDPVVKVETCEESFERFWNVYPRKAGKPNALKAWKAAIKRADPNRIISGAERYAEWLSNPAPGEFRPQTKYPQGWLNDDRWTEFEDSANGEPREEDLSRHQHAMLLDGRVPPSMADDNGQPNAAARYWLKKFGYGRAA